MKNELTRATRAASPGSAIKCELSATSVPIASSGGRHTSEMRCASTSPRPEPASGSGALRGIAPALVGFERPTPASALADQPDRLDAHAAIDGLAHVIDGERRDGDGGERLHLDAGLADRPRRRLD